MSIRKNYFYNLLYRLVTIVIPLVSVPYVSRVLGAEGVGVFSYISSITYYFVLLSLLGIDTYGTKSIAMVRENKNELSKTFLTIYGLQVILTLISLTIYLSLVFLLFSEFKIVALIQAITVASSLIDCTWLFNGLEKFKKLVTINISVKLLGLINILIFVNDSNDLPLYSFIMCISTFLGQLILFSNLRNLISFKKVNFNDIIRHLKPTISFFLPQVAIQIYFVFDKTMLGLLSSKVEVGIYDYTEKILKISLTFITSLSIVLLPKIANTYAKGDIKKVRNYITSSLEYSTFIAVPMVFGLAGVANEFLPWYLGSDFLNSINVLIILSPALLLMALSGVFGGQYLLPLGKIKLYTISVYIGALVNVIVNLILIPPLGSIGAAVGTLCAEVSVLATQIIFIKNDINIKTIIPSIIKYSLSGLVMFSIIRYLGIQFGVSPVTTLLQIVIGGFSYLLVVLIIEIYFREGLILNEIKKKYKRIIK